MHISGYKIGKLIGSGTMTDVYVAAREGETTPVALKVLQARHHNREDVRRHFSDQAKKRTRLKHANIAAIYELQSTQQPYYYSTELLPPSTLRHKIVNGLSEDQVCAIATAVTAALAYAHDKGVIHRNLRPENVFFRNDGTVVVTDFGLARPNMPVERSTLDHMIYVSPQVAGGEEADVASDLYALGIMLYEMLTARYPYQSLSAALDPAQPAKPLPKELYMFNQLIQRLIAKDPMDRFQSAHQVRTALTEMMQTIPTLTPAGVAAPMHSHRSAAVSTRRLQRRRFSLSDYIGGRGVMLTGAVAISLLGYTFWPSGGLVRPPGQKPVSQKPASQQSAAKNQTRQKADSAKDVRIQALLAKAKRQADGGRLTGPAADNALQTYREVLLLDRGNRPAAKALKEMAENFEKRAWRHIGAGNWESGLAAVNQGLKILPDHQIMRQLRENAQAYLQARNRERKQTGSREQQIALLLEKAETQWQAQKVLSPAGDNAYESYLQVLKLDRQNRQVKKMLERIPRFYRDLAQKYLDNDPQKSLKYIKQGLAFAPRHPELKMLQSQAVAAIRLAQEKGKARQQQGLEQQDPNLLPSERQVANLENELRERERQEQRRQRLQKLLSRADEQWRAKRYAEPAGDNAAESYRRILLMDPLNEDAIDRIAQMANHYESEAKQYLFDNELKKSLEAVNKGLGIMSNHMGLRVLRDQIVTEQATRKKQPASDAEKVRVFGTF